MVYRTYFLSYFGVSNGFEFFLFERHDGWRDWLIVAGLDGWVFIFMMAR